MINAIAITGPTASGKTALSLSLAEILGGEIISMDSMQIYRGMDVGTAKATPDEQKRAPHHMLDVVSPKESFSSRDYREMALPIAKAIADSGKTPIFVGGTGLYLASLKRAGLEEVPPADANYRDKILATLATEDDRIALWERLREIDPVSAEATHYNNVRRVIRAIEIYEKTGVTKSEFDRLSRQGASDINILHLTLDFHSRDTLYSRIDKRVDLMLEAGLYDEVTSLYERGELLPDTTAAQAIGYKEIIDCIKDGRPLSEAVQTIKQGSRNYAKRQLTWFRHEEGAFVIYADGDGGEMRRAEEILNDAIQIINEHFTRIS